MKNLLLIISLFFFGTINAQEPAWVNFTKRQSLFPNEKYYTGFSACRKDKNESVDDLLIRLKKNATDELGNSVKVTVESVSTMNIINATDKFFQSFKHSSTSFSKVDLIGMETETYYDKKKKTGFAFVYVKKNDLIVYYQNMIGKIKNNIAGKIKAAEQYISMSDEENALKTYYECLPLFREAESAQTIVLLLKASELDIKEMNDYELKVKKGISSIFKSDQLNLSEVCNFMAYGLKIQTGKFSELIRLGTFTYEDTKMGSPFSRRFAKAFEKELIKEADYKITTKASDPLLKSNQNKFLLTGTYWKEGNNLKIIAILRNLNTSQPIASAEGLLPLKWLEERGIFYKPENFGEACENMRIFKKNEITNGGMLLDVWTNKGNESPIFEENDTLVFYIRANHECYVRIINYFADGTKVLLVDNLYIGSDKVNKVIKLPKIFYCAPPFGTEVLQANAQTEAFNPLRIKNQQGYDIILGVLDDIISNTRGFKPLKNEDMRAEKRIIVTTMKK